MTHPTAPTRSLGDFFYYCTHTQYVYVRAGRLCGFLLRNAQFPYLHCIVLLACVYTPGPFIRSIPPIREHISDLFWPANARHRVWIRSGCDALVPIENGRHDDDDDRRDDDAHLKKYRKYIGSKH